MPTPLEAFMGGGNLFEEIKVVLSDVSKRPLFEVLSYLVRSEEYSAGIYILLRNTLPKDYWRIKFGEFVEKKLHGEEKLRRIVRELYPDIEFEGEAREWSRMFLDKKLKIKTVGEYLEVLEVVMELEELGERVYSYLSGRLTGEGKFLMLELAGLSRSNYVTLKEEYEKVKAIESDMSFRDFLRELRGMEDGD